jgi:predicted transposase YbfD/YdcC
VDLAGSVGTGRELLDAVDLDNAVVTADAVHAQRETAEYIAGKKEDGNRESDYFLLTVILSFRVSQACDLRRPVVDSVADETPAA